MSKTPSSRRNPEATRQKLVAATVRLMLKQGFAGTSVEEICTDAGVTKGSFFHHFESKEAIGKAAVEWWGQMGTSLYSAAWDDDDADPLDQVHHMLDIMAGFTRRSDEPCICMVGMMTQELAATNPVMRDACEKELNVWTENVARMLKAAKSQHRPDAAFDPEEVAWFLNSLWQGSMLVGKARQSQAMIRANLELARSYVDSLFGRTPKSRSES